MLEHVDCLEWAFIVFTRCFMTTTSSFIVVTVDGSDSDKDFLFKT